MKRIFVLILTLVPLLAGAAVETTLSIIKPDAVKNRYVGAIIGRLEDAGLHPVAIEMRQLTREEAAEFYLDLRERPFYGELVEYMTSGPVVVMALEGENAIARHRKLMGATDSKKAAPGTIRADFAESIKANAVHGSDGPDAARRELMFFFK